MGFGKMHSRAVCGLGVAVVVVGSSVAGAATYSGNGASGFGGPIGNGTLSITESAGVLTFVVTPAGGGVGDNKVALYLDTTAGGFDSTASLTDNLGGGDFGRKIITGGTNNNGDAGGANTKSVVNFAAGFGADYAISINPNDYIGVFQLNDPANYTFKTGTGSAGSPFTVSVSRADLGLGATDGFKIVGSLISGTFYRSNETFGTSSTVSSDGGSNAAFNGTVTFSDSIAYVVPEPATLTALAGGGIALLRRRRRA